MRRRPTGRRPVRESTLAALFRYRLAAGHWPTTNQLLTVLPDRPAENLERRLDALVRQGLIVRRNGRIIATSGVTQTETM